MVSDHLGSLAKEHGFYLVGRRRHSGLRTRWAPAAVPALGPTGARGVGWKLPPAARDRAEEFGHGPGLIANVTPGMHLSTRTLSSE